MKYLEKLRDLFLHPTQAGLVAILIILSSLSIAALAFAEPVPIGPPKARVDSHGDLVDRVDRAMLWLVTNGIPKHDIGPNLKNAAAMDPEWRRELAEAIVAASRRRDVPAWDLVAIAFREGSFRREPIGDLDEHSTFQIVPDTASAFGCDTSTAAGSADCAALLLDHWRGVCGGLWPGFMRYATGRKICRPDTKRLSWMIWDRPGISRILRQRFGG
jgi:hypothetical protein